MVTAVVFAAVVVAAFTYIARRIRPTDRHPHNPDECPQCQLDNTQPSLGGNP